MPPSYTLYTPAGSFRAFAALIAAEYNGIDVIVDVENVQKAAAALSPTGKAPVLQIGTTKQEDESPPQVVFGSHAIARFLAGMRRDTHLLGRSFHDTAAVDAWMDFAAQELELPACVWFYPAAGYMPFNQAAYTKAKDDLARGLTILNQFLVGKKYLVGDSITLADICVVSTLLYPFKLVCDKAHLEPFDNVVRWFTDCVKEPEFGAVIGQVTMCKKEIMAVGQEVKQETASRSGSDPKGASKETKKDIDDDKSAPPAPATDKKKEHPLKVMDREKPTLFSIDEWKKTYSNATSRVDAMKWFWENLDKDGWSLWLQEYNHNEENKRVFMVSNAIAGFHQRTDEIRRWAFGVQNILGTEETLLENKGVWLLRGDSVEHMINANDDANWYTWKRLDPNLDEDKAKVTAYWCNEDELEGKPIQDSKVFK